MKIGIQTLANKKYTLEVPADATIATVKQQIATELQLGAAELQKLIYSGKILKDDTTLESNKVKEGEMMVCMVSKAKPAAAAATSATASSATAATPAPAAAASTPAAATPAPAQAATTAPAAAATTPAAASTATATPAASSGPPSGIDPSTLENLMALGFSQDQVVAALRAAFNNPDRAAEYLFNGIPSNLSQPPAAAAASQQQRPAGGDSGLDANRAAAALAAGGAAGPMDFSSLGIPQAEIDQIRQLLASQPQLLPMLLQNLAHTNPELLEAIQQNPQAFMQMLGVQGQGGAAGGAGGAGAGGAQGGPRQHVIQVTEAEQQSIMNLINLGFDRHRALEAYLICDRNEEAAANYLFEHAAEYDQEENEAQAAAAAGGGAEGGAGGHQHMDDDEEGDDFLPDAPE